MSAKVAEESTCSWEAGMAQDSKFSYSEVHNYLTCGEYPPECDRNYKRSLRRKAANFKLEGERLLYIGNQEKRPGVKLPTGVRRIVVESAEEQRRIVRLIHDEAHLGKRMFVMKLGEYKSKGVVGMEC